MITIRLQSHPDGRGELGGQLHDLDVDTLPDRVQHQLDPLRRENYDLRWGGDIVRKDDDGIVIYGWVGTDEDDPLVERRRNEHPLVGEHTLYVVKPTYSDLHAEAEVVRDNEIGYEEHEQLADDPTE